MTPLLYYHESFIVSCSFEMLNGPSDQMNASSAHVSCKSTQGAAHFFQLYQHAEGLFILHNGICWHLLRCTQSAFYNFNIINCQGKMWIYTCIQDNTLSVKSSSLELHSLITILFTLDKKVLYVTYIELF